MKSPPDATWSSNALSTPSRSRIASRRGLASDLFIGYPRRVPRVQRGVAFCPRRSRRLAPAVPGTIRTSAQLPIYDNGAGGIDDPLYRFPSGAFGALHDAPPCRNAKNMLLDSFQRSR